MHRPVWLVAFAYSFAVLSSAAWAADVNWHWRTPLQPCKGDCAFTLYAGSAVRTNVQDIFFTPIGPTGWDFDGGGIVAGAASRRIVTFFDSFDLEIEVGVGQRFGNMRETEGWAAIYGRWTNFPWNKIIYTTLAVSSGPNYATGVSDFERRNDGTRLQNFFSPELTFALPDQRDKQLVIRLHHRSGAYGVVSNAGSGATYISGGFRIWF